tara:strand:+ start:83 stop:946 length:864 start_codon:yes stop_codon:yes gene_type:complete
LLKFENKELIISSLYFSQHGQDFIVDRLIKNPKVMIEVGCIDGLRHSNTYYFEKNSNSLIYLYEPHKDYTELIKKNRPNSIFKDYAISDHNNDEGHFFQNYAGTFSNLSDEFKSDFEKSPIFDGYKKVDNVLIRTLNFCIEESEIKSIDFLSIDIDGNDLKALEGMNLSNILPTILCIEMNNSLVDYKLYRDYLKTNSKYKYFLVQEQDLLAFKYFSHYLRTIFLFKNINLFYSKYPFGDTWNTDRKLIYRVNGLMMLHKNFKLQNFGYRQFLYRINKLKKILLNSK